VSQERGPLSLVSTTKELLGSNSSGSDLESRKYGLGIRHADHVAPSIHKRLALTSLTSNGRSVGIVRLRTEAMEFLLLLLLLLLLCALILTSWHCVIYTRTTPCDLNQPKT
jgi:hypothetical protein